MVRCRILGPLAAEVAGTEVALGGLRPRSLLAALLLDVDRVVDPEALVAAVWGDRPPASARALLSVHVSALRKSFVATGHADDVIETVGSGYRVRSDTVLLDAHLAAQRVDEARAAAAAGRHSAAEATFRAALDLWQGPVLDGLCSPPIRAGAQRLAELRLAATEEWAELALLLGHLDAVVDALPAVLAEQPLRERARAQLMLALARSDRKADALALYEQGHQLLVEQQGLEPGAVLTELRDAISDDALPVQLADPAAAVDPYRLAELPPAVPHFTGRQTDLAVLDSLLDGSTRHMPLAVISGAAGTGKTTLALQWAHRVAHRFADGQLFADLRGYDPQVEPVEPAAVLEQFLRALGVSGEALPATVAERAALFRSTVHGRRLLVLLDNAASANQVRPLLPGSDTCCVLVTARRRLEGLVAGVGALAVPIEMLSDPESVALVRDIVGADRLDGEPVDVAALAALCGGLPLALRVVAARLTSAPDGTAQQLVDRLASERDRLDQLSQQELQVRGSFQLSYRDLSPAAKVAFRRLGLVDTPGGFAPWLLAALTDGTIAAAEELCEQLVDAQLVQPLGTDVAGQPRYRFHDLVRLFARERAATEEPAEAADAGLARAFGGMLAMADEARIAEHGDATMGSLRGQATVWWPPDPAAVDPLRWFESERSNLVAATRRCAAYGWHELSWDLVVRWLFMFEARAYYDDWQTVTEHALRSCREAGSARGEASMLYSLGVLELNRRRLDDAIAPLTDALATFERLDDPRGRAAALRHLATVQMFRGEHERGLRGLETACAVFAELGDGLAEANALGHIAYVHTQEGRLDVAERLLDRALRKPQATGRPRAQLLKRLTEVYRLQGRPAEAAQVGERALWIVREARDPVGEAYVLHALGETRADLGEGAEAERLLRAALTTARQVGERLIEGRILLALGHLDTPESVELLTAAVAVFEGIGAAAWRETASKALAERR